MGAIFKIMIYKRQINCHTARWLGWIAKHVGSADIRQGKVVIIIKIFIIALLFIHNLNFNLNQWRNYTWAIVGNAQVALWTAQVALPSD